MLIFLWLKYRSRRTEIRIISSFLEAAAIPPYRKSLATLKKEISRVRRYNRPLSVVVVQRRNGATPQDTSHDTDNGNINPSTQPKRLSTIAFLLCGPILRDAFRAVDITTYDGHNDQFIITLPETTHQQAVETMQRVKNIIGEQVSEQLSIGISEFPEAGLIIEDLVARGMTEINQNGQTVKT